MMILGNRFATAWLWAPGKGSLRSLFWKQVRTRRDKVCPASLGSWTANPWYKFAIVCLHPFDRRVLGIGIIMRPDHHHHHHHHHHHPHACMHVHSCFQCFLGLHSLRCVTPMMPRHQAMCPSASTSNAAANFTNFVRAAVPKEFNSEC